MAKSETFQELDLSNAFLFALVLGIPEVCRLVLELILGRPMGKIEVHVEKSLLYSSDFKSVRLDVYASEAFRLDCDIEMQNKDRKNLPKRSRFYQAEADVTALKPGEDYSCLRDNYIIFICTFDPFGKGLYRYIYENICHETGMPLNDGTKKIFLNTKGRNDPDVPPELVHFLKYVENTTDEFVEKANDPVIKTIHDQVTELKKSREWEAKYMKFEELLLDREQEGREEGLAQMSKLIRFLLRDGQAEQIPLITEDPELRDRLFKKYHI